MSITAGDGLLRFGHQVLLTNNWTHSAKFTGEKSQLQCCLATGVAHTATTNGGTLEVTATGTTTISSTLRTAFVIRRLARIWVLNMKTKSIRIETFLSTCLDQI